MAFAPIHNHTEYSALDGLSTCREIAERCQCIGCSAVGITDHGTASGHLEFAKVMQKHDIKPIFGCELYHGVKTTFGKNERDQSHFVAGALTDEGLRNVWRLVDAASTNFRYVGRVNWEMLEKHSEGVFATSACIQGLVPKGVRDGDLDALNRYLEIYKGNFYIEIHTYPADDQRVLNQALVEVARERGVPLIYATDAHFASPEQYEIHDAYVAMQTGQDVYTPVEDRKMWHPKALYIMDEAQVRENLSYLPEDAVSEALENSALLAERCNAQLPEIRRHLATFIPKECPWTKDSTESTESTQQMFLRLVEQGIADRYGEDASAEVWERTATEMEVFLDAGLEHYFLQAWDFCQFCDRNGIKRGPGRGSAAGAIVAYALRITDVDPLRYDLIFERFYNPGRAKGFPDIDNDFPVSERKRVRQYLMDRWGEDRVRAIGTITRLKPKAAIDRTYKACGISWDEKEALKALVEHVPDLNIHGADSIGWSADVDPGKTIYVMHSTDRVKHDVGQQIIEWVGSLARDRQELVLYWLQIVEIVCSRVSGYGVHPSGVVVSDVPLADELPCMWNTEQKIPVTCFPMADVDNRQFVKQDLLGLRNLDTLEEWERQLQRRFDWWKLTYEEQPEEMWKLLDQGITLGVFQIEDGYGRQLCKEFKPRSIDDLGVINALNRPGPIRSGAAKSYVRRRDGLEAVEYDHPCLEDLLEPTYGFFVYQEQVIRFFERKLGYSLSEADAVRKILGKKMPEEMRDLHHGDGEWAGKGYLAACDREGIDRDSAEQIWSRIEDFASYSFNKSHAICYATIAFRTLYAKWSAPAEFIIACIRTNPDSAGAYVSEGRRMGVAVFPPDIGKSRPDIAVVDGEILFGFSNVKGIGMGSARFLCKLRDDFPMIDEGPERLGHALAAMQGDWEELRDRAKESGDAFKARSARQQFRSNQIDLLVAAGAWDRYSPRDVPLATIQKYEKDLLQVILTDDCDEIFAANTETIEACDDYADLEYSDAKYVHLPGVIATITPKRTKKDNKAMGIVTIEYRGEQVEFVVFPKQWTDYKFLFQERTPGIFTLSKNDRGVRFEKATKLRSQYA